MTLDGPSGHRGRRRRPCPPLAPPETLLHRRRRPRSVCRGCAPTEARGGGEPERVPSHGNSGSAIAVRRDGVVRRSRREESQLPSSAAAALAARGHHGQLRWRDDRARARVPTPASRQRPGQREASSKSGWPQTRRVARGSDDALKAEEMMLLRLPRLRVWASCARGAARRGLERARRAAWVGSEISLLAGGGAASCALRVPG